MKKIILLLVIFLLFSSFVIAEDNSTGQFLNVGDSMVVDGQIIKLVRVDSANAVIVDVNGIVETIYSGQNKTINGIGITNKETYYDPNNQAASAATLIIKPFTTFENKTKEQNISVPTKGLIVKCSENSDCFLNVKDTTYINGRNISLIRVGSAGAVIVDVDGALETIHSEQTKTIYSSINNIEIKNKETFFEDYDSPSNAATLIMSLSKNQNISNFRMVWREDNIIIREEPFYPNEDMCGGYRCLKGNEVSPTCYNLKECKEVCDGICWDIKENEAIVTEKVPEITENVSEYVAQNVTQKPVIECNNGCLDENNNCIPVTVRINNKFCDISKELKLQLSGESPCNNNYECDSNVCVSNKCISTSFLEKIIDWFKKIFG